MCNVTKLSADDVDRQQSLCLYASLFRARDKPQTEVHTVVLVAGFVAGLKDY
jgi:hypothetical protein